MNVLTTIFWLGFGVLLVFGSLFQYHEILVGLCALVIRIAQLVALLRGA
jgi:hypothetical protein